MSRRGFLAAAAEKLSERLLYTLCRHCATWRGAWRLDLLRRIDEFRFAEPGTLVTQTRLGFPIEVRTLIEVEVALHAQRH